MNTSIEINRRVPAKKLVPFFNLHGNPDKPKGPKEPKEKAEKIKGEPKAKAKRKARIKGAFELNEIVIYNGSEFAVTKLSKALRETRFTIRELGGIREIANVKASSLSKSNSKAVANKGPAEFGFSDKVSNAYFKSGKKDFSEIPVIVIE